MEQEKEHALELATDAGHILLENGAEISRVEDTMRRISGVYGVGEGNFFVLSNGIIATGREYADARFIPIKGTQLSRVVEVNQLSRDIVRSASEGEPMGLDEVERRLQLIRNAAGKPWWEITLGVALGVGAFCILFGGSLIDAAASFGAGLLLGMFMAFVSPHLSRIFSNVIGGAVGGALCILAVMLGLGQHLPNMIIGTIIALVPGVPFTNGIRDLANEDYLAGTTRLLDAFLAFLCIALGVVLALMAEGALTGGLMELGCPTTDELASHWAIQLVAAWLGTVGFSALFGAPRRFYVDCGWTGMVGWAGYLLGLRCMGLSAVGAAFVGATAVAAMSQLLASARKCPSTVFLICGIIPLVPGGGIFWTAYYLVSNQLRMAADAGFVALKVTIAIAGGIIVVAGLIRLLFKKKKNG